MPSENETAIARLLEQTAAAHGDYETTALGGVFDEVWPAWYANYLIEHGLLDLLPATSQPNATELGAILAELDASYRGQQPAVEWPRYYAERLAATTA